MVQSVCPSVCLSVTPFFTMFPLHHHEIAGVITNDRSDVHAKCQGQKSRVKVTEVMTQLSRFWTVTSVPIHIWWWNDASSLMLLRRGALLFFKVIRQISRSHGTKKSPILTRIERCRTVTSVYIRRLLWNDAQSLKHHRGGALLFFKVIRQFPRSNRTENCRYWPELSVSGL